MKSYLVFALVALFAVTLVWAQEDDDEESKLIPCFDLI